MSDCVIDIGSATITFGFFSENRLLESRSAIPSPDLEQKILPFLREKAIEKAFVSSTHEETNKKILKILNELALMQIASCNHAINLLFNGMNKIHHICN